MIDKFIDADIEGQREREREKGEQCDHIGRFIALWATFQSLWHQLICPIF